MPFDKLRINYGAWCVFFNIPNHGKYNSPLTFNQTPLENMFNSDTIKKFDPLPTPFYYYDLELLHQTLQTAKAASQRYGYKIHYALKANVNDRLLNIIRDYGFGADCVSGNEIKKALEIGFPADEIVFAGVGKSDLEIEYALESNIHSFNCESQQELEVVNELAEKRGKTAAIALRINPDLDAKTHHYITTGKEENKFGIYVLQLKETLARLRHLKQLKLIGLHFHIGSQITDFNVFKNLCLRVNEAQEILQKHDVFPGHINMGGGLGANYQQPDEHAICDFEGYFALIQRYLKPLPNQTVHFEIGRAFVGQCGTLISRALFVKSGLRTNFVVLDAGMTELIRPALYQASHKIENLTSSRETEIYDVVGPICESSDCFGKEISLPKTQRGDLIAIRTAGAYGQVMTSQYNLREPVPTIYSDSL